jgi:dihydroneopterin aldolase
MPQLLEVDVELEADLSRASRSDRLEDTVDYGPLIATVRSVVEGRSFRLLEAIAGAIADEVLGVTAGPVTVRVRKLAVPVDADLDHAQVSITRSRGTT